MVAFGKETSCGLRNYFLLTRVQSDDASSSTSSPLFRHAVAARAPDVAFVSVDNSGFLTGVTGTQWRPEVGNKRMCSALPRHVTETRGACDGLVS
ncbi:hypothetical protein PDJAM_G00256450 [Pangasius djambal]|uniref:Uncharacterized protein n=1 Tax=Pangasius djambal TaxID=1691987 RepID=A0ACC5YLH8_9TELE|nr:hypothetical protein [Pangasius djambal]